MQQIFFLFFPFFLREHLYLTARGLRSCNFPQIKTATLWLPEWVLCRSLGCQTYWSQSSQSNSKTRSINCYSSHKLIIYSECNYSAAPKTVGCLWAPKISYPEERDDHGRSSWQGHRQGGLRSIGVLICEGLIWSAFGTRCVDVLIVRFLCAFFEDSFDSGTIVLS